VSPTALTDAGKAAIAAILADPAGTLVGTDYDGTLAPSSLIRNTPKRTRTLCGRWLGWARSLVESWW
jgi:hypothetical protein